MTTRSWIRKLFARPVTPPIRKRPHRARLALQALEDRTVPSTFTVTNLLDDGSVGSLRWAVGQANATGGDQTVDFDPTVFATPQTITLAGSQLELTDTTGIETITGPAAGVTVSGGGLSRVFQIDGGVAASISGLTISGGFTTGNGGGLANLGGTLTLTACTVSGNSSTIDIPHNGGAGVFSAGGTTTLINCTLSGNSVRSFAGGGGGLFAIGGSTVSLTNCTVSGNSAGFGGGLISDQGSSTTLTDCTVSGNSAEGGYGGVLCDQGSSTTLTDCTVSGNSAGFGGGLGAYDGDTVTLTNCTVSGNSAGRDSGGLRIYNGAISLTNTIVAGNSAGYDGFQELSGSVNSNSSYNLIGPGWSGGLMDGVNHNQVGVANPGLGTLGDHGGPTQTIDLVGGSPALNAGDPAQLGLADQRGVVRTGGVNIGAYQASASAFVLTAPDTVTAGMAFDVTVTAVDVFGQVAVGYTGTVTFSTTDPDPNVVLPPDYPFTLADGGMHTFTQGFTLQTPGMSTLTATATAGGFASSVPITVTSGPGGGGSPSPNMPPHRHGFRVVDRFFAALPGDPELLRLRGTARRGEGPSRALLWAARHGDRLIRKDDCFECWNCGEGAGAFYG
jgi:hypothetical protein